MSNFISFELKEEKTKTKSRNLSEAKRPNKLSTTVPKSESRSDSEFKLESGFEIEAKCQRLSTILKHWDSEVYR